MLFQEYLLLLFYLEIVQGKAEGDAKDKKEAMSNEGQGVVCKGQMHHRLVQDKMIIDIVLRSCAQPGDRQQGQYSDEHVQKVSLFPVEPWYQP